MAIAKFNIRAAFEGSKEEILKDLIAEIKLPIKDLKMKSNTQFEFTIGQNSIIILNFEYKKHQFHWKENLGSIAQILHQASCDYFKDKEEFFKEEISKLGFSINNITTGCRNIIYVNGNTAISYCFNGIDWIVKPV